MKNPSQNLDVADLLDEVNKKYSLKAWMIRSYNWYVRPGIGPMGVSFALFMIGILVMIRNGVQVFH